MTDPVSYVLRGQVAVLTLDDGKANALSFAVIESLHAKLDAAQRDARAVVIAGRPGRFSGGFDLSVVGGPRGRELVATGAELVLRVYQFPMPVVIACTGHAIAGGAFLLLAADTRVGADGEYKIGINEVAIGMSVPKFAVELARDRLSKAHFVASIGHGRVYAPAEAVGVGYLDEVVPAEQLSAVAHARAQHLATTVDPAGFARTRLHARGDLADQLRAGLRAH